MSSAPTRILIPALVAAAWIVACSSDSETTTPTPAAGVCGTEWSTGDASADECISGACCESFGACVADEACRSCIEQAEGCEGNELAEEYRGCVEANQCVSGENPDASVGGQGGAAGSGGSSQGGQAGSAGKGGNGGSSKGGAAGSAGAGGSSTGGTAGSGGSVAPPAPVTVQCADFASETEASACASYGAKYCSFAFACARGLMAFEFATQSACEESKELQCKLELTASGSKQVPATYAARAKAYDLSTCESLHYYGVPQVDCGQRGTIADGEPCIYDVQCSGGFCQNPGCGTCKKVGGLGEPCGAPLLSLESIPCEKGLRCGATSKCEAYTKLGQGCMTMGSVCDPEAYCSQQTGKCEATVGLGEYCTIDKCHPQLQCGKNWICEMPPYAKLGESCDPKSKHAGGCDWYAGLECGAANKCVYSYPGPGQACTTLCRDGSSCESDVCVPTVPEGQACGFDVAKGCLAPAWCIAETCTLPTLQNCDD